MLVNSLAMTGYTQTVIARVLAPVAISYMEHVMLHFVLMLGIASLVNSLAMTGYTQTVIARALAPVAISGERKR